MAKGYLARVHATHRAHDQTALCEELGMRMCWLGTLQPSRLKVYWIKSKKRKKVIIIESTWVSVFSYILPLATLWIFISKYTNHSCQITCKNQTSNTGYTHCIKREPFLWPDMFVWIAQWGRGGPGNPRMTDNLFWSCLLPWPASGKGGAIRYTHTHTRTRSLSV